MLSAVEDTCKRRAQCKYDGIVLLCMDVAHSTNMTVLFYCACMHIAKHSFSLDTGNKSIATFTPSKSFFSDVWTCDEERTRHSLVHIMHVNSAQDNNAQD